MRRVFCVLLGFACGFKVLRECYCDSGVCDHLFSLTWCLVVFFCLKCMP